MEPISDEERNAAEVARAKSESELPAIKAAFRAYAEREKDPIKQARLRDFIPYVDKALDFYEIEWFRTKAIQTAEATRVLADRKIAEDAERRKRAKQISLLWLLGLTACAVLVLTGIGKVYYYSMPDGTELKVDEYEGRTIKVNQGRDTLKFSHEGYGFNRYIVIRATIVLLIVAFCAYKSAPLLS